MSKTENEKWEPAQAVLDNLTILWQAVVQHGGPIPDDVAEKLRELMKVVKSHV